MVKLGLTLAAIAILIGCTSKENSTLMNTYAKKQNIYKYLQKTEKVQFKENNITTLMLTATYMNKPTIDIDDKSDEVFLIGLYNEAHAIESLNNDALIIELKNVLTKKEAREKRDEKRAIRKARREKLARLRLEDVNATLPEDTNTSKTDMYMKPIAIEEVPKNSPLLKGISFVSDWNQFYLLKYKHIAGNKLTLRIKSKKSQEELAMEKEKQKAIEAKKKTSTTSTKKKKSKKKKINLYHSKTLQFAKVAKYAL